MRYLHKRHHAVLLGLPVVVLLASAFALLRPPDVLLLSPSSTPYLAVGERETIRLALKSDEPVNAFGGTIHVPEHLSVVDVDPQSSLIDLWTVEPTLIDNGRRIRFSGGTLAENGFTGNDVLFRFTVEADAPGTARFLLTDGQALAADGRAGNTLTHEPELSLHIREADRPSPDVNEDQRLNLFDLGLLGSKIVTTYDARYDLNGDGSVSFTDLFVLLGQMR